MTEFGGTPSHETLSVCLLGPVSSPVTNQLTDQRLCTTDGLVGPVGLSPSTTLSCHCVGEKLERKERSICDSMPPSPRPSTPGTPGSLSGIMADVIPSLTQYTVAPAWCWWAHSYANRHMFQAWSRVLLRRRVVIVDESYSYCPPCLIPPSALYLLARPLRTPGILPASSLNPSTF